MDKIIFNRRIELDQEIKIEGPPLEALRFQTRRPGTLITVTDSQGNDFRGRIIHLSDREASIFVFDGFPSSTESPLEIILLQALPEKERMELIIQKATELGVSQIFSFKSARSISLEERESKQRKAHRWQEIAVRAVQQSRRAKVPSVSYVPGLEEAMRLCQGEAVKVVLWERRGENLKALLKRCRTHKIYAMVGPEGGFQDEEVALAKGHGFVPIKLGQRILRTETAAITLLGILQYELGDLAR